MGREQVETNTGDRLQPAQQEWLVADMVYPPAVPQVGHLAYIAGFTQQRENAGRPTGAGRVLSVHPSLEGHTEILHLGGSISLLNTAKIRDAGEVVETGKMDQVIVDNLVSSDPRHMKWPITAISTYGWVLALDPWLGEQHWLPPRHGDRVFGAVDRPYEFRDDKQCDSYVVAVQGYILESGILSEFMDTNGKYVPIPAPIHTTDPHLLRSLELGMDFIPEKHPAYVPFEVAKWFVGSLGMGRTDWLEMCWNGIRPNVIPERPDRVYAGKGWADWEDFLGLGMRYRETRTALPEETLSERHLEIFQMFKVKFAVCRSIMEPRLAYRRRPFGRRYTKPITQGYATPGSYVSESET